MIMRDVLDGIEDLAIAAAWETAGGFEIISITPPSAEPARPAASVHRFRARRTSDVLSFLLQRERRLLAAGLDRAS